MKTLQMLALVFVVLLLCVSPVAAQSGGIGAGVGAGIGAGICIVGAGWGFGRIGSAALESMARQPEVAGKVQVAMIIIGALLEGATFFALLVCIQLIDKVTF